MIQLNKNYRLEPDGNQWTLVYEEEKGVSEKTGKPIISRDQWYCSTLSHALRVFCDQDLKNATSVKGLMERIDELHTLINRL